MQFTTLSYLFSAIAQSSAAFVAFIAVFVIFKLQIVDRRLDDKYEEARIWLMTEGGLFSSVEGRMPRKEIKQRLDKFKENEKAKAFTSDINEFEEYIGDLPEKASHPLKNWIYIFFCSLVSLALFCNVKPIGTLCAILILIFVWITLWDSRTIIQDCLSVKLK